MANTKSANSADILVARVKQDEEPCFIAGCIVNSNALEFRAVKDFHNVGVFHTLRKEDVHLSPCPQCPQESEVLACLPTEQTNYDDYQASIDLSQKAL